MIYKCIYCIVYEIHTLDISIEIVLIHKGEDPCFVFYELVLYCTQDIKKIQSNYLKNNNN